MQTWRGKSSRRRIDDSPPLTVPLGAIVWRHRPLLMESVGLGDRRSIGLDALYLNAQQHILLETHLLAVVHTEFRAIEAAARVGAAHVLLDYGVLDALERIDGERHRLRHTVERQ